MQIDGYDFTERMQATLWNAAAQAQALNHEYIGTEHLLLVLLADRECCSRDEAQALNHSFVSTEHLLLRMLGEGKGIAAQVLADAGVSLEQPAFVRVVLEYMNAAVVSKDFTTTREAVVFLEGQQRV